MNHLSLTEMLPIKGGSNQLTQYNEKNLIQKARANVIKREEIRRSNRLIRNNIIKENHGNNKHSNTSKDNVFLLPRSIRHFNDLLKKEMRGNQKVAALHYMMDQLNKVRHKYLIMENKSKQLVQKDTQSITSTSSHVNSRSCNHLTKIDDKDYKNNHNQYQPFLDKPKHRKILTQINLNKNFYMKNNNNTQKHKSMSKQEELLNENEIYYFPALPLIFKVPSISHLSKATKESKIYIMKHEAISHS